MIGANGAARDEASEGNVNGSVAIEAVKTNARRDVNMALPVMRNVVSDNVRSHVHRKIALSPRLAAQPI
jgi:hypothetical protein